MLSSSNPGGQLSSNQTPVTKSGVHVAPGTRLVNELSLQTAPIGHV